MKSFKQFVNNKKKKDDNHFAVLSDVFIHFKAGVDDKHGAEPEVEPSVKKEKTRYYVKEDATPGRFEDWKNTNDNAHLGDNHEEVGNTLRHTESPLHSDGGGSNPRYQGHRDAIGNYTRVSHELNSGLMGKNKDLSHPDDWNKSGSKYWDKPMSYKGALDKLDETTHEHRAKQDHVLYSGLTFDPRKHLQGNNKFMSPAFISATHSKDVATKFTKPVVNDDAKGIGASLFKKNKTHHIMHINVPAGARAMNISPLSHHEGEHESLIGRNSKFEYSHSEHHVDEKGNHYLIHHVNLLHD
jgi:hypothetical protein